MNIEDAISSIDKRVAEFPGDNLLPLTAEQREALVRTVNRYEHEGAAIYVGTDRTGIAGCPVGCAMVAFRIRGTDRVLTYGVTQDGKLHS